MSPQVTATTLLAVVPALALGAPTWLGNFETGDLSQWGGVQRVAEDRLHVVTRPAWEGRYALAATVQQGDDPIGASGNRAELESGRIEPDGSESWYRWAVLFPSEFPSSPRWQLFTQWHHDGCCGSPPVEFHVTGEQVTFTVQGDALWRTPLVRGAWHEFLFHVRWSADPTVGFAELWFDGAQVLPRTPVATAFAGMGNYLKVGYYRDASIQPTATVYVDGMVQGATREDVVPTVPSVPAPPVPADAVAVAETTPPAPVTPPTPPAAPASERTAPARAGCASAPVSVVAWVAALRLRLRRKVGSRVNP